MALTEQGMFESAVRYLQRYAASTAQLRRVLERKIVRAKIRPEMYGEIPKDIHQWIEKAVTRCVTYGYVDDRRYTEERIRILRRQGRSTHYILRYLNEKGVPKAMIAELMPRDEDAELQAAIRYVRRRRLGRDSAIEARQKDLAKLARAGFGLGLARQALEYVTADNTDSV